MKSLLINTLKAIANIVAIAVTISSMALCAILGAVFGFHLFVGLLHF